MAEDIQKRGRLTGLPRRRTRGREDLRHGGEAQRRRDRGTDIVVGIVETHGRAHTAEMVGLGRRRRQETSTAAPPSPRWTSTR